MLLLRDFRRRRRRHRRWTAVNSVILDSALRLHLAASSMLTLVTMLCYDVVVEDLSVWTITRDRIVR